MTVLYKKEEKIVLIQLDLRETLNRIDGASFRDLVR